MERPSHVRRLAMNVPAKMVVCYGLLYITPGIYVLIYFDVSLMFFFLLF